VKKGIKQLGAVVGLIAAAAIGLTSVSGSSSGSRPKTTRVSVGNQSIVKIAHAMQSKAIADLRENAFRRIVSVERTHVVADEDSATNSRPLESVQAEYPVSRTVQVLATGYSSVAGACTATMTQPRWGEIAVDPNFIPLGSYVEIPQFPGVIFHAEDTGGAIKGWRIDIWFPTTGDALQWGVKSIAIRILQSAPTGVPSSIPCK
jgi:3D (Asp-Asp-Asp) domain-containing protein